MAEEESKSDRFAVHVVRGATAAEFLPQLGKFVANCAAEAVEARGRFTIAISGGSLPKNLAAALKLQSESIAATSPKWHVFYADERCVELTDDDSNHKACQEALYDQDFFHTPAEQIYTIDAKAESASAIASDYQDKIAKVFLWADDQAAPEFDLVLLGMGPDGHTASLFPNHELLDTPGIVLSLTDSPKPPPSRITLSLTTLCAARRVAFVCTGASKKEALESVWSTTAATVAKALPSGRVRPASGVTWFVDEAAAPAAASSL